MPQICPAMPLINYVHTLSSDSGHSVVGTHDELLAHSELYRDLVGLWLSGASAV